MLEILERICAGEGKEGDIELLQDMAYDIKKSSLCGPRPNCTQPDSFDHSLLPRRVRGAHQGQVLSRPTSASVLKFAVVEGTCKKCRSVRQGLSVDAIRWEKGQIAFIELDKCTQCTSCYDACPFMAIE